MLLDTAQSHDTGNIKFTRYSTESPATTSTGNPSIDQFVYNIASETLNFYRIPFGSQNMFPTTYKKIVKIRYFLKQIHNMTVNERECKI